MKRELAYITFLDILFILLLSVSGGAPGVFSEIIYYFAFLAPIALGFYFIKITAAEGGGAESIGLRPTRNGTVKTIPLILPIITAIYGISLLTGLIMGLFGFSDTAVIEEPLPLALMLHALVPAILEEVLFRYIPLKMMLPHSPRWAVLLSALFFGLCHNNLFRIPYAIFAGLLFALVDIMADSVLPSVILHFLNNTLSLLLMEYAAEESIPLIFLIFIALSVISLIPVVIYRKSYKGFFKPLFKKGEAKDFSLAPLALLFVTLTIAITNLLSV